MTFEDAPDVLYVEEVAQLLRIGRNGAYELVGSGLLRSVKIGRRIIVPKSELRAFLDRKDDLRGPNSEDVA
jgi:excisionase family DNA binding protein